MAELNKQLLVCVHVLQSTAVLVPEKPPTIQLFLPCHITWSLVLLQANHKEELAEHCHGNNPSRPDMDKPTLCFMYVLLVSEIDLDQHKHLRNVMSY